MSVLSAAGKSTVARTSLDRQPADSVARVFNQNQRARRERFGLLGEHSFKPPIDGAGPFVRQPEDHDTRASDDPERENPAEVEIASSRT